MPKFKIIEGYTPGLIGRVVELHGQYYSQQWKFGVYFESKVGTELSQFMSNYDPRKDRIFSVVLNEKVEGSLTIQSVQGSPNTANLRWFIMSDELRGQGAGAELMNLAMTFCMEVGCSKISLWTFAGLDAARALYEKNGFKLVNEQAGTQWGKEVVEQKFERVFEPGAEVEKPTKKVQTDGSAAEFTAKQINDIAQDLDIGFLVFINKDTREIRKMIDPDDIYAEEEHYMEDLEIIESWPNVVRFEKMDSREGYQMMEDFAHQVKDGRMRERLFDALNGRKPFRNFRNRVDDNENVRQAWFKFKNQSYGDHVRETLEREFGEG